MKIGFNFKKIINAFQESINYFSNKVVQNENNIANHETRITTLENNSGGGGSSGEGSNWIEITSENGQEAIIPQPFSEIRMQATSIMGYNYSVTYNYDETIFHNTQGNGSTYMICGNPTANNYGCKFKYMVASDNNQYVCVDSCFSGSTYDAYEFKAWIKPVQSGQQ